MKQMEINKLDIINLLNQMINEENEKLTKLDFYNLYGREAHANNKYCLSIVKQLIERRMIGRGLI